uniref:Uncharacterized protein n=1 Tax=Glossina pallidipes TaxID=7398 RepID=A0A1A9ZL00_GLOPL
MQELNLVPLWKISLRQLTLKRELDFKIRELISMLLNNEIGLPRSRFSDLLRSFLHFALNLRFCTAACTRFDLRLGFCCITSKFEWVASSKGSLSTGNGKGISNHTARRVVLIFAHQLIDMGWVFRD